MQNFSLSVIGKMKLPFNDKSIFNYCLTRTYYIILYTMNLEKTQLRDSQWFSSYKLRDGNFHIRAMTGFKKNKIFNTPLLVINCNRNL